MRKLLFIVAALVLSTTIAAAENRSCLPAEAKTALAYIEKTWGRVVVVSTFRKNAFIAGSGNPSYHASCRAVDFHPPRGSYRAVLRWLRTNWKGGLGTYSGRMRHFHIDNGPYVRFHHRI
jgi:uncharacterized protein YcbK (DUF882 family)